MRICAFIGDMYRDYSTGIIQTLQKCAIERGHQIDIFGNCSVPNMNPLFLSGLKSVLYLPNYDQYDGVIVCADTLHHAGMNKDLLDVLSSLAIPVVNIRSEEEGLYCIVPDNRRCMYDITKFVLSKCDTGDIGFVTGIPDLKDSFDRLLGFQDAMTEAGHPVHDSMIFHGNYWINQGPETADFFIKDDGTLPHAIICSNDYMAIALMDELIMRGYQIPKDTWITGFDNITSAAVHEPSLTTTEIRADSLAIAAMDSLEKLSHDRSSLGKNTSVTVPGQLVPRASTEDISPEVDNKQALQDNGNLHEAFYDRTRSFILMSSDFEDVFQADDSTRVAMSTLQELNIFKESFLIRNGEEMRTLCGYCTPSDSRMPQIEFPYSELIPASLESSEPRVRIFLPIHYKSEVFGYGAFVLDPDAKGFINEKLEFLMYLLGQTHNRLILFEKFNQASSIMDLYVKDALTGLFNRRGFEKNITGYFHKGVTQNHSIAVASIDMDGLKWINDNLGHAAGDEALKGIANCLQSVLKPGEIAARMGGDEFEAVLILDTPARIGHFIRSFRKAIENANNASTAEYKLSASVGTCEVTEWDTLMECMNKADKIMYIDKKEKKCNRR